MHPALFNALIVTAIGIVAGLVTVLIIVIDKPRMGQEIVRRDKPCELDSASLIQILKQEKRGA